MTIHTLPPAEKQNLKLGYMQLSDSAPLVLAKEAGLYADMGLDVQLIREVSWANLRDRLVMGDLDAAQILAPLPMMTSYGAGGLRANIITGLVLSLNGNAITLSGRLSAELGLDRLALPPDPAEASKRLQTLIAAEEQKPALTFATVHLFSMHTIQLRLWLQAGGIDPDRDVRIIVLPPAQMCDSLARGIIDGYCVGEPWNTLAVSQGVGSVVSSAYQIWNNSAEKVLGITERWHQANPGSHLRLRVALMRACQQLADRSVRAEMPQMLSRADYLNLPEHILAPSLTGNFRFSKTQLPVHIHDFHVFWDYQACFPWRSSAEHMLRLSAFAMARPVASDQARELVQRCYRTDLYREAARHLGITSPSRDYKTEGEHSSSWQLEPGISLGADLVIDREAFGACENPDR